MSLVPENQKHFSLQINLAPMIDFLFLMLSCFAVLAVTRTSLFDTKLSLAKLQKEVNAGEHYASNDFYQINISIDKEGGFSWMTDMNDYSLASTEKLQKELLYQHQLGVIPQDKSKTKVLLHIDKKAPWEPIAQLIFAIRQVGFEAHPLYESDGENQKFRISR